MGVFDLGAASLQDLVFSISPVNRRVLGSVPVTGQIRRSRR